jgi:pimeloyl-ACP methyl ester carboxylesterase
MGSNKTGVKGMGTHLDGISRSVVTTPRGHYSLLEAGQPDGQPVLFVHGNVSAATFWEETMLALPPSYRALAPDLRGYGESERLPVDAARGLRDFSDDLHSLIETLGVKQFHLVGHSMGGNVAMQYAIDYTPTVRSLSLIAPGSPYGFGGTRDLRGTPCWSDYAGSGGGLVSAELIMRLGQGDRGEDSTFSPRSLLRLRYVKPPFVPSREDALVEAMLQTAVSKGNYSRDMTPSPNWPHVAPGTRGVNNALSPKYCNLSSLADMNPRPPIIWVHGSDDQIVSDKALSDPAVLGAMGILPGWPGQETYPPQPMISQVRAVLNRYRMNGGSYDEHVIANVAHMPHIENPGEFLSHWLPFLQGG